MNEHLIFFDSECPFCHQAVRHIIEIDVHQHFLFAPLKGETARDVLSGPQRQLLHTDSLVLVENYQSTDRQFWVRSRAILRVYWLVDNGWGILGIFSFLPGFIGDFFYRLLAAHRHQFKLKIPLDPGPKERFLP